ncbi:MAG: MerR family transcriptional regulator [Melioribacteraceae bacterium]|jgi:DNA-binding transcriptional MerR regulator|nr:MerR family transcriptional regulator [Melioribacteraceae bacterium]
MKDFGLKKLYYSISEVSKLTSLEQYILRYWETEFDQLTPSKNRAGNRIYTNKDIKLIIEIKTLLREQKYTIEGAKKILSEGKSRPIVNEPTTPVKIPPKRDSKVSTSPPSKKGPMELDLMEIRNFLVDLKSKL